MNRISRRFWKNAKTVFKKTGSIISLSLLLGFSTSSFAAENGLRVLPLSPALAEWTAELVGLEPIVGITEYTDYPAGIEKKRNIGPYHRINFEVAMSLKPTLVLASTDGNSKDQIELFRAKKIPTIVVGSSGLNEMIDGMRKVAEALGKKEEGDKKLRLLEDRLAKLDKKYGPQSSTRTILVQVGADPLIVVGRKTYISELLSKMRRENVVRSKNSTYPRISVESVLGEDPSTILVLAMKNDPKTNERMSSGWKKYDQLSAVKTGEIRVLMSDELMRPGLRLVRGIDALESALESGAVK